MFIPSRDAKLRREMRDSFSEKKSGTRFQCTVCVETTIVGSMKVSAKHFNDEGCLLDHGVFQARDERQGIDWLCMGSLFAVIEISPRLRKNLAFLLQLDHRVL